jgi:hypothetical protein
MLRGGCALTLGVVDNEDKGRGEGTKGSTVGFLEGGKGVQKVLLTSKIAQYGSEGV